MIKKFFKTLKEYIDYLMKVDFKELFVNTVILLCLVILAAFVYIPIGLVQDLLNSFIQVFITLPNLVGLIYIWIFNVLSAISAILAFMYMFNKRFESIKKDENKDINKEQEMSDKKNIEEEFDLPKVKDN